jgi:hypothetical protein
MFRTFLGATSHVRGAGLARRAVRLASGYAVVSALAVGLSAPVLGAAPMQGQPASISGTAQTPPVAAVPPAQTATAVTPPATPAPATSGTVIPALTPLKLTIGKLLVSKANKPGEFFPLTLAEPIMINGTIAIPAGTEGIGEVVESKGGGMGGSPGVLILAARYLTVDSRQLRLRSMHIARAGTNNQEAATAIAIAGGLTGSFVGLLMVGGKVTVPAGTIAEAKTAEQFTLGAAPATATAPAVTPTTMTTTSMTTSPEPLVAASARQTVTNGGIAQ